jgi:hypothetical protein
LALTEPSTGGEIEPAAEQRASGNLKTANRMIMFVSLLGVLLITLVVFLLVWGIARITLGR